MTVWHRSAPSRTARLINVMLEREGSAERVVELLRAPGCRVGLWGRLLPSKQGNAQNDAL